MTKATVIKGAINVGKIAIAAVGALAMAEIGCLGTTMLENDVDATGKLIKHKKNPTVYKVKKGRFGKSSNVTVNPITGTVKPYTGTKQPVNKKPHRFYV